MNISISELIINFSICYRNWGSPPSNIQQWRRYPIYVVRFFKRFKNKNLFVILKRNYILTEYTKTFSCNNRLVIFSSEECICLINSKYYKILQTWNLENCLSARQVSSEDAAHRWRRNVEQKRIQPQTRAMKPGQQIPIERRPGKPKSIY